MTSKKRNSIESLVDSILQQQQQQRDLGHVATTTDYGDRSPKEHRPYTLLIQHTQSFLVRYDHSNSYQQRQQHSQQQQQPWILQSGELWLEYIANLILQQQQQQQFMNHPTHSPSKLPVDPNTSRFPSPLPPHEQHNKNNVTVSSGNNNNHTRILFLTTLPLTSTTSTLNVLQTKYGTDRVQSISCCQIGSFVDWNNDNESNSFRQLPKECDLERLDTIITAIQNLLLSSTSNSSTFTTISAIFIDSITPILIRHGYTKMIQFIQQLIHVCKSSSSNTQKMLMVIPIRVEMLTSVQHIILENTMGGGIGGIGGVDAILNVVVVGQLLLHDESIIKGGESYNNNNNNQHNTAFFLRRGVSLERRDYIRRDMIPYQVIIVNNNNNNNNGDDICNNMNHLHEKSSSSTLVKNTLPIRRRYYIDCLEIDSTPDDSHLPNKAGSDNIATVASKLSTVSLSSTNDIRSVGTTTKAVSLQLDDGTRRYHQPQETKTISTNSTTTIKTKPNIYLEENDPDFYDNDYDEDEPDDDLDL